MVIKEKINNYRIDRQTFVARACVRPSVRVCWIVCSSVRFLIYFGRSVAIVRTSGHNISQSFVCSVAHSFFGSSVHFFGYTLVR